MTLKFDGECVFLAPWCAIVAQSSQGVACASHQAGTVPVECLWSSFFLPSPQMRTITFLFKCEARSDSPCCHPLPTPGCTCFPSTTRPGDKHRCHRGQRCWSSRLACPCVVPLTRLTLCVPSPWLAWCCRVPVGYGPESAPLRLPGCVEGGRHPVPAPVLVSQG